MIKTKILDENYHLITTPHYPWDRPQKMLREKPHKAIIGIGGNIGDVLRRFERLFWLLRSSPFVDILQSAPILRNPPFGFTQQAHFYNSLLVITTQLTPRELLEYLLRIEKRFGRKRLFKDAPRTLDLDIIFYDDLQISSKRLTIPHPKWMQRESVLIPLKFLKRQQ